MSIRIGTNVASIFAQRQLGRAEKRTSHALQALSSGSRIVQAGDDAAGFAISENLRGQEKSLQQARNNAESAKGLIQVAEGGLNEQNNILIRLRELSLQSASDTVGDEEREFLNVEFQQLKEEFERIAQTTTYGDKKLLVGEEQEYEFHLGTQNGEFDIIKYTLDADTTASTLQIDSLSIDERDAAREVLVDIDDALKTVAGTRAGFGAIQSRLEIAGNNLELQYENVAAARSRISDADMAYEVSELTQGQVQKDFGIAVLAQANQDPVRALRLLG
ncbi:MAG: flagellin FliC [Bdellovibrionaceae bacterium]|nr:flagellin FliC [Pseudobdellovibrionaceae bacterium]